MKMNRMACCTVALSFAVAGCATGGMSDNQVKGTAIGCAAGGALGALLGGSNRAANAAIGCLAGGATGYTVASLLDQREQQALADARLRAAANNERVEWSSSPDNSAEGDAPPDSSAPADVSSPQPGQDSSMTVADTGSGTVAPTKPATPPTKKKTKTASNTRTAQTNPSPTAGAKTAVPTANGWIIPVKTYVAANGETCRDMQEHAEKNGNKVDENVTMCKSASGWVLPQSA